MELAWQTNAWEDYLYWQKTNKKMMLKINELIRECLRHPFEGTGKPEPLKGNLRGLWSRRIDGEHRLVYTVKENKLVILQCRYHYD